MFRVLIQPEQTSSIGLSALGSSLMMENSCSDAAHLGLNPNRLVSLFFLEIESPAMQCSLRPRLQAPGCFAATSWYLLYHQRGGVREMMGERAEVTTTGSAPPCSWRPRPPCCSSCLPMGTFYVHGWAVTLRPRQEEGEGLEEAQVSPAGNTQSGFRSYSP